MFVYICLLLLIAATSNAVRTFHGHQVISTVAKSISQLKYLQSLEESGELDFWTVPDRVGKEVNIHVLPDAVTDIQQSFSSLNLDYKIKVENLQSLVDGERDVKISSQINSPDVLTKYGTQPEIYRWLEDIVQQCGDRCSLMPFGRSNEGREMKILKISAPDSVRNKPAVFVDGGIHAREWIAPVFVNNIIDKLVNDYDSDIGVRQMLAVFDWYLIPLLNPDGYQYSHDEDRMWRKSRAKSSNDSCQGVDLNRNFGYQFGGKGTSADPCSELYRGPSAFSEPESQAMRDFISRLGLNVYLSFHSYGQYIVFPWGYDNILAPNHEDLEEVARDGAAAFGKQFWIVGNSAEKMYPTAGASDDWAYGVANATYSYTIELPPKDDRIGFLLPEWLIPDVVSSVWPGVKAMMRRIIEKEHPGALIEWHITSTSDGSWVQSDWLFLLLTISLHTLTCTTLLN